MLITGACMDYIVCSLCPFVGTEDETANNASEILEIVCTEMLGSSAEEVHTPSVGVGNPLPPMTGGTFTHLVD